MRVVFYPSSIRRSQHGTRLDWSNFGTALILDREQGSAELSSQAPSRQSSARVVPHRRDVVRVERSRKACEYPAWLAASKQPSCGAKDCSRAPDLSGTLHTLPGGFRPLGRQSSSRGHTALDGRMAAMRPHGPERPNMKPGKPNGKEAARPKAGPANQSIR